MRRFGPEVVASIEAGRKLGIKMSLFDDNGCLLWFCAEWEMDVGRMEQWKIALGLGWLEFIHEEDLAAVRAWIRLGEGAEVVFRSAGGPGEPWQIVALKKHRVGLYWLAVGNRRMDLRPRDKDFGGGAMLVGLALALGRAAQELPLGRKAA